MFKRLFWLLIGFGSGIGTSWYVVRSVKRTVRRTVEAYAPAQLASRAGHGYRTLRVNARAAWVEGRDAMRAREAELWSAVESSRNGRTDEPPTVDGPTGDRPTGHSRTTDEVGDATATVNATVSATAPVVPLEDELAARRRRLFATPLRSAGTRR